MRWIVTGHALERFGERAVGIDPGTVWQSFRNALGHAIRVRTRTRKGSQVFRVDPYWCYLVVDPDRGGDGMVVKTVLTWLQGQRVVAGTISPEGELDLLEEDRLVVSSTHQEIRRMDAVLDKTRQLNPDQLKQIELDRAAELDQIKQIEKTLRHQITVAGRDSQFQTTLNRIRQALRVALAEPDADHIRLKLHDLLPDLYREEDLPEGDAHVHVET